MDIKAIIRELLFEHDCVIIPGFGGFIGNFTPARIDRVTGMFHPPLKQISFNRNLNHNDGLLISRISRITGMNYGESRRSVEEFVMTLKGRLARGEKVVFDHTGWFVNNHENNIQFEPEANINYYAGSFGLESFHCLPSIRYDIRKRVTRHIDKEPLLNGSVRRNLWRAAVIVPLLALIVSVPLRTDLFKPKIQASNMNPLITAELESNRKAVDEAAVIIPVIPFTSDDTTSKPAPEAVPETVTGISSSESDKAVADHYSVITGSFKSEQNAFDHLNELRAEGFNPEINQASNGFYRVTAARCRDIESATATRDSISKKFPGSWVSKL